MPNEDTPKGGKWERRDWNDPATVIALVIGLVGLALVMVDGLDSVLFDAEVTFGYWPHILMGLVGFWFFGVRLYRLGGPEDKGD